MTTLIMNIFWLYQMTKFFHFQVWHDKYFNYCSVCLCAIKMYPYKIKERSFKRRNQISNIHFWRQLEGKTFGKMGAHFLYQEKYLLS